MFPSSHQVSLLHETRSAEKLVRIALTEHKFDIGTETEVRMKLVERNLLRTKKKDSMYADVRTILDH